MEARNAGYSIVSVPGGIRFEFRSRASGIATLVLAGFAAIAGINGLIQVTLGNPIAALILASLSMLAALVAGVLWRVRQRERPEDADLRYFADLRAGVLRDAAGRDLCALRELTFARKFDPTDSLQGRTWFLRLVWPEGHAVVFKAGKGAPPTASLDHVQSQLETSFRDG